MSSRARRACCPRGAIDVKPLITRTFPFEQSVEAFAFAAQGAPDMVKTQIVFPGAA